MKQDNRKNRVLALAGLMRIASDREGILEERPEDRRMVQATFGLRLPPDRELALKVACSYLSRHSHLAKTWSDAVWEAKELTLEEAR